MGFLQRCPANHRVEAAEEGYVLVTVTLLHRVRKVARPHSDYAATPRDCDRTSRQNKNSAVFAGAPTAGQLENCRGGLQETACRDVVAVKDANQFATVMAWLRLLIFACLLSPLVI